MTIPPPVTQAAIELLGWLELPLDDAPALIVTGFNEGCVPVAQQDALFVPEALRRHLGLPDQSQRYARDAYNLAMLAASRTHLTLIAGRRTPAQEVLLPSRLLFTCEETPLLSRTLAAFAPQRCSPRPPALLRILQPGQVQARFPMPRPGPLGEPVVSMRVTAFRDYLACPYRYYLQHHLKLQSIDTGRRIAARSLRRPPAWGAQRLCMQRCCWIIARARDSGDAACHAGCAGPAVVRG